MSKTNVVIVGGGYGANLALELSSKLDSSKYSLILINNRPFRIHVIAGPRLAVSEDAEFQKKCMLPYDRIFHKGKGTFKHGTVTAIEKVPGGTGGSVVLADGERIDFGVLVLATGSKWTGPVEYPLDDVVPFIERTRQDIKSARKIVLVGAGAVGLELSGEIKDEYSDKAVTIIHSQSTVLNDTYPAKYRTFTEKNFRARDIQFVLDDVLEDLTIRDGGVTTRKGQHVEADLVLSTRGNKPNTDMIVSSLGHGVATKSGHIRIKPTLQLSDHPDIFAIGDILDVKEQKQAIKAGAHASLVASNIVAYLSKKGTLKKYGGSKELIFLSNGKNGGTVYLGLFGKGLVFGDSFARMAKGKNVLVPMFASWQGY